MPTLLVVDDEPNIIFSIAECLSSPQLRVISATTAREGLELARVEMPEVVLLDIRLPDMSGLDAFQKLHEFDPRLLVIMITAYARTETAIEAMSRGAFDYLVKPVDLQVLQVAIDKALEVSRLNRVPAIFATEAMGSDGDRIVGNCAAMQDVYKAIGRVALHDEPVLILGESGTGKELVARAIYHYSRRKDRPFLAINCAALPESLLESELFGHERGAFTGADQRRIGKFEQVNGGTIFLDEIGDMSPATQAKALRLLQEQRFERVGGNTTVQTDVRIITATNQDLQQRVQQGRFRLDLLYRLNGFTIHLPPLRERKADIPLLIDHFVARLNRAFGKQVHMVTDDARELLMAHDWPGNVREFQSALKYAVVHATADVITPDCLPPHCAPDRKTMVAAAAAGNPFDLTTRVQVLLREGERDAYRRLIQEVDRIVLQQALEHTRHNQAQTAELLGISRMTLRGKLRSLGLLDAATDD